VRFVATELEGAFLIFNDPRADERGWFARTFDRTAFEAQGLASDFPQHSISFNARRGTLRGMHFQAAPYEECKIIRCTRGSIHDVVIDLRHESSTFGRHVAVELSAAEHLGLYVPKGCAHGFLTLEDESDVLYLISENYHPELARGVRWNDPAFGIRWPMEPILISDRDAAYPDFTPPRRT
jgi:dTDP-4-dehydrorhamnose 3,5-epimerase